MIHILNRFRDDQLMVHNCAFLITVACVFVAQSSRLYMYSVKLRPSVRPSVRLLDGVWHIATRRLIDWLEFNGTFSTFRLYRAFRSYSLRFGK